MELYNDQIHNGPFIESCDYIWSDDVDRTDKSGVWDYYKAISEQYGKPLVNRSNLPSNGIIFVGMCHILEDVFKQLPADGNYIFVHRTNDRPYTEVMNAVKPSSVKHVYTVDCKGVFGNVSAIPFGNSSINGEDNLIKQIAQEPKRATDKKLFVCYNTNPSTPHRTESIKALRDKPFAFVYELEWPHRQMAGDEFYRNVRDHKFTMALAGCGADASRQWAAIQLGSIPIITDCPEMRHFADMPLLFCPPFDELTEEWLDKQVVSGSTERMRASYWKQHIKTKRDEFGI